MSSLPLQDVQEAFLLRRYRVMATRIDDLLDGIGRLEHELEIELNRARAEWRYRVEAGRVRFEREARALHRRLKQSVPRFISQSDWRHLVTAPVIYSMAVPIALLDVWITVYQAICFRAYR